VDVLRLDPAESSATRTKVGVVTMVARGNNFSGATEQAHFAATQTSIMHYFYSAQLN
jgi:hypothetical protein